MVSFSDWMPKLLLRFIGAVTPKAGNPCVPQRVLQLPLCPDRRQDFPARESLSGIAHFLDCSPYHSFVFRNRRALLMTETELKLMAAPAMMGLSSTPKNG